MIHYNQEQEGRRNVKIILDVDEELDEDMIHIKCSELNQDILEIQEFIQKKMSKRKEITVYKDDAEFFIRLSEVLFFETFGREIILHTEKQIYTVKKKLYELEALLPDYFVRISKSAIVNVYAVYSVNRSMVANGVIEFRDTHKEVSISRSYYKNFKIVLDEKRR